MITEYFRPQNLEEALTLLSRPDTRPLAGGTVLSHSGHDSFAVVDLQSLGLDKLRKSRYHLEIGATVTLQKLLEYPHSPPALKSALKLDGPLNLRNMGTVAGTLVTCDGRSPFAAVMLALDAKMTVLDGGSSIINLGDFLPIRQELLRGKLITKILIPLSTKIAFETVGRSPADKPIVCVALAQWRSGRSRLVVGGWGRSPSTAMDGKDVSEIEEATRNAAHDAGDQWASAEYRSAISVVLAQRCLKRLK
jgi:CO/xanthine dehydrogenase FAD-binding subunit